MITPRTMDSYSKVRKEHGVYTSFALVISEIPRHLFVYPDFVEPKQ